MQTRPRTTNRPLFVVGGLLLLAVLAAAVVLLAKESTTRARAFIVLLLLVPVAVAALVGWSRERALVGRRVATEREEAERLKREAAERAEEARRAEQALQQEGERHAEELRKREDDLRRVREELQRDLSERDEAIERERRLVSMLNDARELERRWNAELRREVMELQQAHSVLGDPEADVPTLVLRIAIKLLGAEKGLLLSRNDQNGDGRLDLLASQGFQGDPKDSELVQRFAHEVIEQDQIVREDNPRTDEKEGEADQEIRNLVAIPIYVMDRFSGVVVCANRDGGFEEFDEHVLLSLGDQAGAVLHNARLRGELRSSYVATVRVLSDTIEAKDGSLRGHCEEVADYAGAVADRLGLESSKREEIVFGSLLHDVGKIGISERILLKPGPLTPEEFAIVKLHPRIGYRLVQRVPALDGISLGILHHHEHFDGNGYPAGLKGDGIPLEARIICVADAFSAMTTDRPYRGRLAVDDACAELQRFAGSHFDPEIVRVFVEEVERNPHLDHTRGPLAIALEDAEVAREPEGTLLGQGPFALTDSLTLLYSRRYLHETAHFEAERAELQGSPFAVILLELSGVGALNRREGYAAGDEAIQEAARIVQRAAIGAGATACRYGGTVFALVAPKFDETTATQLGEEVAGRIEDGLKVRVAVAAWAPGQTGDDVIDRASAELAGVEIRSDRA